MARSIQVLVRDRLGIIRGELKNYGSLAATKRWRDVGAWSIGAIPLESSNESQREKEKNAPQRALARLLGSPGYGVVIKRRTFNSTTRRWTGWKTFLSGPAVQIVYTKNGDGSTLTVSGFDDLVRIWDVTATPGAEPWNVIPNDIRTGAAETVIKGYVTDNSTNVYRSGAPNIPPTKVLSVAADTGRGATVKGNARFDILGDLVQSLAIVGGLGLTADDLVFDVYESQDRSRQQVFSFAAGNLIDFTFTQNGPTCTSAIVGARGEGTDRIFVHVSEDDNPDWGRSVERFIDDRNAESIDEVYQKANEELMKGQATQEIAITPIDRPDRRFGIDWNLGDTVTCEGVVAVVTEVNIAYDDNGEIVKPTVSANGNQVRAALRTFEEIRSLRRRLNALERAQ